MTIFRRRSKQTVTESSIPTNNDDKQPPVVLEASLSPTAFWRSMLHSSQPQLEDATESSGSSGSSSREILQLPDGGAMEDCTVKIDPENERNVVLAVDVPPGVRKEDLNVHLDNGILEVSHSEGELPATTPPAAASVLQDEEEEEDGTTQLFQMDEQALDLHKITANWNQEDNQLVITAPMKEEADQLLTDLDIVTGQAPPKDKKAFRIVLDVPGVVPDHIHVRYANAKVQVSAQRTFGNNRSFKRTFVIDTRRFEADRVRAFLYKGQLTVVVPPRTEHLFKAIPVQEEEESEPSESVSNSSD